ncbi:MAG: hypothetical protein ACKO7W_09995 [Elainella sp.]
MTASLSRPQTEQFSRPESFRVEPIRAESIQAEQVLACDWRDLTSLGVSPQEARMIARTLITKRLISIYWRRLTQAEVPPDAARCIARTVAKYDVLEILPTSSQQQMLHRHCPAICRSGLWRVEMLLQTRR